MTLPVLDNEGLVPALRQQLDMLAQDDEIAVEPVSKIEDKLEPTAGIMLFRSLQEALRNVREHARASRVALVKGRRSSRSSVPSRRGGGE